MCKCYISSLKHEKKGLWEIDTFDPDHNQERLLF